MAFIRTVFLAAAIAFSASFYSATWAEDAKSPATDPSCDPNVAKCGKRGVTLSEAFKELIGENEMNPGDAAKMTLSFDEFTVGPVHAWDYDADGPGGDTGTKVFPVHARFTLVRETQYNIETRHWDNTYSCFSMVNDGDCSCNLLTANPVDLSVQQKPPTPQP